MFWRRRKDINRQHATPVISSACCSIIPLESPANTQNYVSVKVWRTTWKAYTYREQGSWIRYERNPPLPGLFPSTVGYYSTALQTQHTVYVGDNTGPA